MDQDYYGYVYVTLDQKEKKIYIGQKSDKIEDTTDYFGSGTIITNIQNDRGNYFLKKIVLGVCYSKEELDESEIECIYFFRSYGSDGIHRDGIYGYNLTLGGDGISKGTEPWNKGLYGEEYPYSGENNPFYNKHHSDDTIKILSEKATQRHNNGEYDYSKNIMPMKKGLSYEESLGEELGSKLRKDRSKEATEKHKNGTFWKNNENPFKNKKHTNETKEKMKTSAKNRPPATEETRKKISSAGLKRSNKISKRNSGSGNGMAKKVDVDLILKLYNEGIKKSQIAKTLGVSLNIIKNRLENPDKWR